MTKDHSNQGGGYDGGDPDAEIQRLAREHEAQERQRQADAERRAQQDRDAKGGR